MWECTSEHVEVCMWSCVEAGVVFDDACNAVTMTPVVIRAISAILDGTGGGGGVCVKHRLCTHVGECEGNVLHGVAGIIKQRGVPI